MPTTRVEAISRSGRKGALAALRDAQMIKTCYAFGLRRNELCRLDVADLRPNPHVREWGTYGSVHVRYGKAIRGGVPRRRTVLAVPEFDWVIDGMRQWVEHARPIFDAADHPALWLTERLSRLSTKEIDKNFKALRDGAGLDPALIAALPAALLRHASDRVRLSGAVRAGTGRARLCRDDRDLHLGQQRLQAQDAHDRAQAASTAPGDQRQNEGDR